MKNEPSSSHTEADVPQTDQRLFCATVLLKNNAYERNSMAEKAIS